jgi:hypothetical protein
MINGPRHLEVTYCDDIREEVGNKFSYMGVYSGELTVPTPLLLPKLCIVGKITTDIDDPLESLDVRIVAYKEDDEKELLSTGPVTIPPNLPRQLDGTMCMVANLTFVLSPFQITEEIVLRVIAKTEREELRGTTALRIRIVPSVAASVPTMQTIQ